MVKYMQNNVITNQTFILFHFLTFLFEWYIIYYNTDILQHQRVLIILIVIKLNNYSIAHTVRFCSNVFCALPLGNKVPPLMARPVSPPPSPLELNGFRNLIFNLNKELFFLNGLAFTASPCNLEHFDSWKMYELQRHSEVSDYASSEWFQCMPFYYFIWPAPSQYKRSILPQYD